MNENTVPTVPAETSSTELLTPAATVEPAVVVPVKEEKILTKHFFNASPRGKLNALWRAWNSDDKRKVEEYHTLVRTGFQKIEGPLTQKDLTKYITMGFAITEDVQKLARKPRQKRVKPVEAALAPGQNVATTPETAVTMTTVSPEAVVQPPAENQAQ